MQRFALVDERLVEDSLFLRRTLGMPRLLSPTPVVDPGQSFGGVLRDNDGLWRMWYIEFRTRDPEKDLIGCATPQCLAYSRDGIHWDKPTLGLVEENGSKDNNIVIGEHQRDRNGRYITGYGGVSGMCVLDATTHPHPKARKRFTALYGGYPKDSIGGICLMHSDDGVHWEVFPESPVFPGGQDTQNTLVYDAKLGKYVCFHRPMIYCGVEAHANRKMARCESDDMIHWSPGRVVLDTDEADSPAWEMFDEPGMRGQRGRIMQFQGLTPWITSGCYLGLTWTYDSRAGTFVQDLVHSPDGINWKREALRQPLVADGRPEGFGGKLIVPASSPPVLVGDEEYFYMSSTPYGHHEGALADAGKGTREERQKYLETTSIYGMAIKRDRWISYDAGEVEGELLTTPFELETGRVAINLEVAAGGQVRITVEDQWGRPVNDWHLDEIAPITGPIDAVDHPMVFGPGPKTVVKVPQIGPIRLRFRLKHAKLFGWSISATS